MATEGTQADLRGSANQGTDLTQRYQKEENIPLGGFEEKTPDKPYRAFGFDIGSGNINKPAIKQGLDSIIQYLKSVDDVRPSIEITGYESKSRLRGKDDFEYGWKRAYAIKSYFVSQRINHNWISTNSLGSVLSPSTDSPPALKAYWRAATIQIKLSGEKRAVNNTNRYGGKSSATLAPSILTDHPFTGFKYEKGINIPTFLLNLRLLTLKFDCFVKMNGIVKREDAMPAESMLKISDGQLAAEFEGNLIKNVSYKANLPLTPGKETGYIAIALNYDHWLRIEIKPNYDWKTPIKVTLKSPVTPPGKFHFPGRPPFTFEGKMEFKADIGIQPNYELVKKVAVRLGTATVEALTAIGESGIFVGGVSAATVLASGAALIALTIATAGLGLFAIGKEHQKGNRQALGQSFNNGYATMRAALTSETEDLYGISEKSWRSKLPGYNYSYSTLYGYHWKEKFEEYSKLYQEGKINPQNVLTEIEKAGKAKMLQDAIEFIHNSGKERWQSFKQRERKLSKDDSARKVAYLTKLNEQLMKGENATLGIPIV